MKGDATNSRRFIEKQADSKEKGSVGVPVTVTACREPSQRICWNAIEFGFLPLQD